MTKEVNNTKPNRCIDPVIKCCQGCKYGWTKYPELVECYDDLAGCTFKSGCMYGLEHTEPTEDELSEFEIMMKRDG